MNKPQVLLIVGPTAVGKTELSLSLARRFDGEIISGDSMQVYRLMDIGTAKVSKEIQEQVPHHLLDILDPKMPFSVQLFQQLATEKIREIHHRGHLPIIVGGTGLYIQAVTHQYEMPFVKEDPEYREQLALLDSNTLHTMLQEVDPKRAACLHPNEHRRIIRALEVYRATGIPMSDLVTRKESPYDLLWIGLTISRPRLYERINQRVVEMMNQGWIEEVAYLLRRGYARNLTSMQAIGYKEIISYLEGEMSFNEVVAEIQRKTRRYAKRQLTWFRRIPEIYWFDVEEEGFFNKIENLIAGEFFR